MSEHARLSPSSAFRWITCTASVALEELYPNVENGFSMYGTAAHDFVADALIKNRQAEMYYETYAHNGVYADSEMVINMQKYLDYVREKSRGKKLYVENRVDLSKYIPDGFGTADVITTDATQIDIIDLKFGKGVRVFAYKNPQLMLYALGALDEYGNDFKKVGLTIHQPRLDHVDFWETTPEELFIFGNSIKLVAQNIIQDKTKYIPSKEGCKFCKAKKDCIAFVEWSSKTAADDFYDLSAVNTKGELL